MDLETLYLSLHPFLANLQGTGTFSRIFSATRQRMDRKPMLQDGQVPSIG